MSKNDPYSENIDLYLEILYRAQKIEDQKLVEMIRRRLSERARKLALSAGACQVIPFPTTSPVPALAAVPAMGPHRPGVHLFALLGGYCGAILLFFVLG